VGLPFIYIKKVSEGKKEEEIIGKHSNISPCKNNNLLLKQKSL
jgi:hypothetical protein